MNDQPDAAPDHDWMPDFTPAAKPSVAAKPAKSAKVQALRPLDALARQIDQAPQVAGPTDAPPRDDTGGGDLPPGDLPPADQDQPGDRGRGKPDRPHGEIWKNCPVKPLGVNGGTYYYLDVHGQLRPVTKHDAQQIMLLFGHMIPKLCYNFPKMLKNADTGEAYRKPDHFEHQPATVSMIRACSEHGLFDPENSVRGVGAWTDNDGRLIYHTGDALLIGDQRLDPGTHQGLIYPAYAPLPHPAIAGKITNPVPAIYDELASWNWRRPDIDAEVALGMMGCLMLGGAFEWRPNFWVTGGKATGKSRFMTLIKHLMGGEKGLLKAENATAASIANILKMSTLPVALDELEPGDQNSSKEKGIVELMRIASSGGRRIRSGPDQKTSETIIRSTFLASSILIPGILKAQDRSRMIIFDLHEFPEGTKAPGVLRSDDWRSRGAALKRLLIDRWPTWTQRLALWREAFAEHRIEQRNADNWATVMAMADMARCDALPAADVLAGWTAKVVRWVQVDLGEIGSDAEDVITWLLSQQIDPMRRGQQFTIGAWLKAAGWRPLAGARLFGSDGLDGPAEHSAKANRLLASYGLRVLGTPEAPVLFVATKQLQGLKSLFDRSDWANGTWSQSLARLKGAGASSGSRYMEGIQTRGTEVPFHSIPGLMALDGDMADQAVAHPPSLDIEDTY